MKRGSKVKSASLVNLNCTPLTKPSPFLPCKSKQTNKKQCPEENIAASLGWGRGREREIEREIRLFLRKYLFILPF